MSIILIKKIRDNIAKNLKYIELINFGSICKQNLDILDCYKIKIVINEYSRGLVIIYNKYDSPILCRICWIIDNGRIRKYIRDRHTINQLIYVLKVGVPSIFKSNLDTFTNDTNDYINKNNDMPLTRRNFNKSDFCPKYTDTVTFYLDPNNLLKDVIELNRAYHIKFTDNLLRFKFTSLNDIYLFLYNLLNINFRRNSLIEFKETFSENIDITTPYFIKRGNKIYLSINTQQYQDTENNYIIKGVKLSKCCKDYEFNKILTSKLNILIICFKKPINNLFKLTPKLKSLILHEPQTESFFTNNVYKLEFLLNLVINYYFTYKLNVLPINIIKLCLHKGSYNITFSHFINLKHLEISLLRNQHLDLSKTNITYVKCNLDYNSNIIFNNKIKYELLEIIAKDQINIQNVETVVLNVKTSSYFVTIHNTYSSILVIKNKTKMISFPKKVKELYLENMDMYSFSDLPDSVEKISIFCYLQNKKLGSYPKNLKELQIINLLTSGITPYEIKKIKNIKLILPNKYFTNQNLKKYSSRTLHTKDYPSKIKYIDEYGFINFI